MKSSRREFLGGALAISGSSISGVSLAIQLLTDGHSDALTLDLPKAKKLVEMGIIDPPGYGAIANLDGFNTIHPEAVAHLFQEEYSYIFLGVNNLSLELAKSFKCMKGTPFIVFNQLADLNPKCARALSEANANLEFINVKTVSIETTYELAKNEGWLGFHLGAASTDLVLALKGHKNCIHMHLANEPSYDTAEQIARYRGFQFILYDLPNRPSDRLIAGLSSNPQKEVEVRRHSYGDYYVQSTQKRHSA